MKTKAIKRITVLFLMFMFVTTQASGETGQAEGSFQTLQFYQYVAKPEPVTTVSDEPRTLFYHLWTGVRCESGTLYGTTLEAPKGVWNIGDLKESKEFKIAWEYPDRTRFESLGFSVVRAVDPVIIPDGVDSIVQAVETSVNLIEPNWWLRAVEWRYELKLVETTIISYNHPESAVHVHDNWIQWWFGGYTGPSAGESYTFRVEFEIRRKAGVEGAIEVIPEGEVSVRKVWLDWWELNTNTVKQEVEVGTVKVTTTNIADWKLWHDECKRVRFEGIEQTLARIFIHGDSEFTWQNGVIGGSGTEEDPYIIEGWDIDGGGTSDCIHIKDTTAYFIIRSVRVHNGYHGILLENVKNGAIENSEATNNNRGIYLVDSSGNTLSGNIVTNNTGPSYVGGITLGNSPGNTLRNNTMANNRRNFGVAGSGVYNDVDDSNTVDGKPIYFWVNEHDRQIPADAGYVTIVDSTNITVKDLTLTNNVFGVLFWGTNNSRIENVECYDTDNCIQLCARSSSNIVSGNNLSLSGRGILIWHSDNNNISCNTVLNNEWYGIWIYGSNNIVSENTVKQNGIYGGIHISAGSIGNIIYHNNLIDNVVQAVDEASNAWDFKGEGNYWSDYTGKDLDGDGIGDTPYVIDSDSQDRYPLMNPWVPDPLKAIKDLTATVVSWKLPQETETSLTQMLDAATNALEREHSEKEAAHILNAFINYVEALTGKKLTEDQADELITAAQSIIFAIT